MALYIIIRAPNQTVPDQKIECQPDWTVKDLKDHLSQVYPNKPKIQDQRLIYFGHLLQDHLSVKDILRPDAQTHVIHLICSQKDVVISQAPPKMTTTSSQPISNSSSPSGNLNIGGLNHLPWADGLHQRFMPYVSNSVYSSPTTFQSVPMSPEQAYQHFTTMHNLYAQYMAQYFQNVHASSRTESQWSSSFHEAPVDLGMTEQNTGQPLPLAENMGMNAQARQVFEEQEEEELAHRDWLDYFYIFSRVFILFSFVFFYSSVERFFIIALLGVIMFLYKRGWFGQRRPVNHPREVNVDPGAGLPDDEENVERQAPRDISSVQNEREEVTTEQDWESNQQLYSPLATAVTFVSTFFSSMIPDQPPPVNVN
ncbi:homocysteine-responsive endoplasmic reticulum-resident ubiquitin-like domain member 2 protein [Limulus polyphemus]|uniref:Homocysteine-responsive endoplasmic reticulum-resident ubiquitin-like domain member 2 protein n=1 Tax=Limulus polyphemus TaxID=6850 RepID=A0ABM1BAA2_LIMPO|nr:homocysteine-responsive endoplasmic reticulum-resident ubiquitin-like domain member 2 protein [Limulus polyphemus]XP_022245590.1 homocysteine-responsive endoplasmic reticulum-resident ubiquitin-like domain member 2 protein [Limulus polyphemus]